MKRTDLVFESARDDDRSIVEAILTVARLPAPDFDAARFSVARGPQGIEGVVAHERHGEAAGIHSLAVLPGFRRRGTGRALLEHAAARAREEGARGVYVASATRAPLARRGFAAAEADEIPEALRRSRSFAAGQTDVAVLRLELGAGAGVRVEAESPREPVASPWRVGFDGSFRIDAAPTRPPEDADGPGTDKARKKSHKKHKKRLEELTERISDLQRMLFAHDQHAVLLVFQAMDAAGKDSTIRHVLTGVNPAGCQVHSFKKPSALELDHDFLWRTAMRLPERGRIGVFNRSYYEEVLVVRVHPGILDFQKLPGPLDLDTLWDERLQSIRDHEQHLARNGTLVLKFFLNVSKHEQRRRFLSRLDEPRKNWKFNAADVEERGHWDAYMRAYQEALRATSRPWAPWFAIPADEKPFLRVSVAEIVVDALENLGLGWPRVDPEEKNRFDAMRKQLEDEG